MNFLDLVRKLARETGTVSPSQIQTIEGAITDQNVADLADWIIDANYEIEKLHDDWRFRMREGTVEIEAGTTDYPLGQYLGDEFFKKVVPYRHPWYHSHIQVGEKLEPVHFVPYREWAGDYDQRLTTTRTGKPQAFTVLPNEQIRIYPTPDKSYTLAFNYIRRPLRLELKDACEPAMPAEMRNVIIYWALRHYAFYDEATHRIQTVQIELDQSLMDLRNDQLPGQRWSRPTFRGGYSSWGSYSGTGR